MKKIIALLLLCLFFSSCRITLITGYDDVLDETTVKMKRDFNLFWLRLDRSIRDTDPRNQAYVNFLEDYDQMDTDLLILNDRAAMLPEKSGQVRSQISNLGELLAGLKNMHKKGIKDVAANDPMADDKRDYRSGINSALNAIMLLQHELKSATKTNTK